jgi:hypothetical protein
MNRRNLKRLCSPARLRGNIESDSGWYRKHVSAYPTHRGLCNHDVYRKP